MRDYFQLVNFEINRFIKIYVSLLIITIFSQLIGTIVETNRLVKHVTEIGKDSNTYYSILDISFHNISHTFWFTGPIALFFAAMFFYIFLIWYRDWFGKSSFIYRLLMLPTTRLNVFLSKATAILIMVLGFVAIQLILFVIEKRMLEWLVPEKYLVNLTVREMIGEGSYSAMFPYYLLIPESFINFLINYGILFIGILVLFIVVLLERSYRWIGIGIGIIYASLAFVICYTPIFLLLTLNIIYFNEFLLMIILALLMVVIGTIWLSHFLLRKKISV